MFKANDIKIINSCRNTTNKFKNLTFVPNIGAIKELTFLISNTKNVFNHLK